MSEAVKTEDRPENEAVIKTGYQAIAEKTLTEQEAANVLGISKQSLAGIRQRNGISYRAVLNTKPIYLVEDIMEYLKHRKRNASFVQE